MINATATSIWGTLATSPAGFYIIPSVKIIRAPAVTESDGQLACATSSSWSILCEDYTITTADVSTTRASAVFSGMNKGVQKYFSGQQGPSVVTQGTFVETPSYTATNTSAYPSTTVISFSTPFLHFPPEARTEAVENPDIWILAFSSSGMVVSSSSSTPVTPVPIQTTFSAPPPPPVDVDNVDYGYLPSGIIPWMLKNPDYVRQYPALASCLIGGPSIEPPLGCSSAAPAVANVVPDLTTGSVTTVSGVGCFHPGNCPHETTTAALRAKPSVTALPEQNNPQPDASRNPLSAVAPIPFAKSTKVSPQASSARQKLTQSKSQNEPVSTGAEESPVPQHIPSQAAEPQGVSIPKTSAAQLNPVPKPSSSSLRPGSPSASTGLGAIIAGAFGSHPEAPTASNIASPIVIGSETLAPGSSPIVFSGTTYSLGPSAIIINGKSSALAEPSSPKIISINSQPITANSASQFIINSQTLAPGSPAITISGSTYSLAPSASALIINGHTSPLTPATPPKSATPGNEEQVFTLASHLVTASPLSGSELVIDGSQTLSPGGSAVTISGVPVSLPTLRSEIIVAGTTKALVAPTGGGVNNGNYSGPGFTGAGNSFQRHEGQELVITCMVAILGIFLLLLL